MGRLLGKKRGREEKKQPWKVALMTSQRASLRASLAQLQAVGWNVAREERAAYGGEREQWREEKRGRHFTRRRVDSP